MAAEKKISPIQRRRQIRFYPDENSLLEVYLPDEQAGTLQKIGLLYDESRSGCAGVFLADPILQEGGRVEVKAGKLQILPAEIRYVMEIAPRLVRVGFLYLA